MAGYPFRTNDLTPEEWEDLGMVEDLVRQQDKKAELSAMQNIMLNLSRR